MKNFIEVENTNGAVVLIAVDSISALERDTRNGTAIVFLIGIQKRLQQDQNSI